MDNFEEEEIISLADLTSDIKKTNQEIKETKDSFITMMKNLETSDIETKSLLNDFIKTMKEL